MGEHSDSTYLYIPKLYLGLINFLEQYEKSYFWNTCWGTFPNSTHNLPWSLWRIRGDIWNTGNATPDLVWLKTPWDRCFRILESPSPQKNENNAVFVFWICFSFAHYCPSLWVSLNVKRFAEDIHSLKLPFSTLKIGLAPKRICIFQTTNLQFATVGCVFEIPNIHKQPPGMSAKTLVNHGISPTTFPSTGEFARFTVLSPRVGGKLRLVGKISGQKLKIKFLVSYGSKRVVEDKSCKSCKATVFLIVYLFNFIVLFIYSPCWGGGWQRCNLFFLLGIACWWKS